MILEYVILLGMGVTIGVILLNSLFGNPSEPQGFRLAWKCLIQSIGQDIPGRPNSSKPSGDCH